MNADAMPSRVERRGRTARRQSGRQADQASASHTTLGSGLTTGRSAHPASGAPTVLPALLTADDVARLLRTTRRAIYAMVEREQLPAPVRLGRRLLLRQDDLARWLESKQQVS